MFIYLQGLFSLASPARFRCPCTPVGVPSHVRGATVALSSAWLKHLRLVMTCVASVSLSRLLLIAHLLHLAGSGWESSVILYGVFLLVFKEKKRSEL